MDDYRYSQTPRHHRIRHFLIVVFMTALVVGMVVAVFVIIHTMHKARGPVSGDTTLVPQHNNSGPTVVVDQPLYTLKLPSDWKQVKVGTHYVTWQATRKNADNRMLTVYTDVTPTALPVNRELPVTAHNNQLTYGELSDNCANFTPGGTLDTGQAEKLQPAPSVWQGVNFVCNLPQVVDNQIGTGSAAGVNTVTVTGPNDGLHSYFFLYTDRNIQPDYTILYGALQSFRAK